MERHAAPAFFVAGALAAFAGSYAVARAPDAPASQLAATLAAEIVFACAALGGTLLLRRDPVRALRLEAPALAGREIAALVAGFVCISHALSLALTSFALRDTGTLGEIDHIVAESAGPSRAFAFLALGIAPAFGEELLFRGFVQQSARPRVGAMLAVALSAALFAAIHLDPVQSPAAFVLGLYLGAVVELGGGLWVAILCHAVNNSLAVVGSMPGALPGAHALWALAGTLFGAGLTAILWVGGRARSRNRAIPPPGAST
ncbi:MAG TPA: CPBP family intramembrane glutamic endopeptidase [Myxococcota bacterium]|nr:CPBP family intramembrane glutamic endopeptidase [Myxococcota bacterium]